MCFHSAQIVIKLFAREKQLTLLPKTVFIKFIGIYSQYDKINVEIYDEFAN